MRAYVVSSSSVSTEISLGGLTDTRVANKRRPNLEDKVNIARSQKNCDGVKGEAKRGPRLTRQ